MAQWTCQVKRCQNLLPYSDDEKYRLRYLQDEEVEALPEETLRVYENLKGKNLCGRCSNLARDAGLKVITVAQVKEWKQKKASNQLLDLISDEEAENLDGLKAGLEADVGGDEGNSQLRVVK